MAYLIRSMWSSSKFLLIFIVPALFIWFMGRLLINDGIVTKGDYTFLMTIPMIPLIAFGAVSFICAFSEELEQKKYYKPKPKSKENNQV